MPLVAMKDLLQHAGREGYAVCAFDLTSLDFLSAALAAAENCRAEVKRMMEKGRKTLGAIPGVRDVFTGRAMREDTQYRYCWLVRFAHHAVIDSYRRHPDHVAFADQLFRPLAADRISIDFEEVR